jgi:hypothetical protein
MTTTTQTTAKTTETLTVLWNAHSGRGLNECQADRLHADDVLGMSGTADELRQVADGYESQHTRYGWNVAAAIRDAIDRA